MRNKKFCTLVIMDGFGIPEDESRSAIKKYNTKNIQDLVKNYPSTTLMASEGAVGLPEGQMGTSEVGHLTMGAGRVKDQSMVEINKAISNGAFYKNPVFLNAMNDASSKNKALHLIGIPTDGGIHSHIDHLIALLKLAKEQGVKEVFVHFLGDGRDTPSKSAMVYLNKLNKAIKEIGVGKIASVIGRFYALDRDNNWDRVEKAYNAMVFGVGHKYNSAEEAIKNAYSRGETDEFIYPSVITSEEEPIGLIKNGDTVILYNYRTDRAKQFAKVFKPNNDLAFTDKKLRVNLVTMTEYDSDFDFAVPAFPPKKMENILGEYLEKLNYKQVRIAETEKYAHVTFFFNDGKVEPFVGEDRVLVNSVKMKSYASKPEMSAVEVANKTIDKINSEEYDVVVVNFANCDMVGHSGDVEATTKAVQVVDTQVERVVDATIKKGGIALVTADHGNADCMMFEDGSPCTSHTTSLVPFILVGEEYKNVKLASGGSLADIAPTILEILGNKKPQQMTGQSLIIK